LERETGARCRVSADISQISSPDDIKLCNQARLILCDYEGTDLKGLLTDLRSSRIGRLTRDYLALFNVSPSHGIEQKYVWEGVRGVFYEQDSWDSFLKGVKAVLNGELWLPREIMTKCILEGRNQDKSPKEDDTLLTRREIEILAQVAIGARNDEIADNLCISPYTVKTHLYNLFKKVNVANRFQAALWAAKNL
jgi:LuxR family transcriptional regulator of csgAB operon